MKGTHISKKAQRKLKQDAHAAIETLSVSQLGTVIDKFNALVARFGEKVAQRSFMYEARRCAAARTRLRHILGEHL